MDFTRGSERREAVSIEWNEIKKNTKQQKKRSSCKLRHIYHAFMSPPAANFPVMRYDTLSYIFISDAPLECFAYIWYRVCLPPIKNNELCEIMLDVRYDDMCDMSAIWQKWMYGNFLLLLYEKSLELCLWRLFLLEALLWIKNDRKL